jgi:cell division protein FtsI (penicillin-binding protein 3)
LRSADVRTGAKRVAVARILVILAFAGLGLRATHLSVFDRKGAQQGEAQSLRTLTLPPERGQIVDRTGAELALSVEAPSIYAIPSRIESLPAAARALAPLVGTSPARLAERLARREGFQFVARWVSRDVAQRVRALDLAGVGVVDEPRRIYPHGALAASVVGFANIDGRGARGVEQQEDAWLRGTTRRLPVERDGDGKLMLVSGGTTWGTAGGDVALTIDAALQADAERALSEAVAATEARGGVILSMDASGGEILTLAESPSFDPNAFRSLDYASTRSSAFLDAVEPGSVLKPFLVAASLEYGTLDARDTFDCENGSYRVPGKTIRDAHPHGVLDVSGILRFSSNICAVKIAQALGARAHFEMLRRFGFGRATGSRFPDESAGVLRPWSRWQPVDHATIAFGQGIGVTSVQLAAAMASLSNGGEWVRPRLVAAHRVARGAWQPTRREVSHRVLGPEVSSLVVSMLETVVTPEGTGRRASLPGIRVAGKTGTAQKFDRESGRYSSQRFRAWFVGVVPADDPRLVIVAGLDEPRRPYHTGGASAAPLFARVAAAQLAQLGIHVEERRPQTRLAASPTPPPVASAPPQPAPSEPEAAAPARSQQEKRKSRPAPARREFASLGERILLPDLQGLTRAEVMQITALIGVRATVSGNGRAIRQDPPPGTVVDAGETIIRIELGGSPPPRRGSGAAAGGQG